MTDWQSIDDNAFIRVVKPKLHFPPVFWAFVVGNALLVAVLLAGRVLG